MLFGMTLATIEQSGDYTSDIDDFEYSQRGLSPSNYTDDEDLSSEYSGDGILETEDPEYDDEFSEGPYISTEIVKEEIIEKITDSGLADEEIIEEIIQEENGEIKEIDVKTVTINYEMDPEEEKEKEIKTEPEKVPEPEVRKVVDVVVTESVPERGIWWQEKTMMGALIAGTIAGIIFATLVILLCVHRIRKKDQGSYPIEHNQKYHAGFKSTSSEKKDCEVFA